MPFTVSPNSTGADTMTNQQALEALQPFQNDKVADVYDEHEEVAQALNTLIDGFEYPDHSHKTIKKIIKKFQ